MARDLSRFAMLMLLTCAGLACVPVPLQAQPSGKAPGSSIAIEGKRIFVTTCAACHGLDGEGGERGPDISHRPEIRRLADKALLQIIRKGVPETAMPAFGSLGAHRVQAVFRYLRSLQGQAASTMLAGDPQQGQALFFGKSGCSQCHMANGEGGFIAPDLSNYAGTLSVSDVRSAITDPNRNLDPRKRPVIVTTMDGQTHTGLARNEDNFSLQLQTTDGTLHLFTRTELKSIEYQPKSLMPDDYASRLSRQELDDLVSYLVSMARKKSKLQAEQK
jgi:cytochrome c oxidase cbb3-type subunit 3